MKDISTMPYERLKNYTLMRMSRDTKFGLKLLTALIWELHQLGGEACDALLRRVVEHADKP